MTGSLVVIFFDRAPLSGVDAGIDVVDIEQCVNRCDGILEFKNIGLVAVDQDCRNVVVFLEGLEQRIGVPAGTHHLLDVPIDLLLVVITVILDYEVAGDCGDYVEVF